MCTVLCVLGNWWSPKCNFLVILLVFVTGASSSAWKDWWTYEGIAGPEFWGVLNPSWMLCRAGKHQSPINIEPKKLVYDPNLDALLVKYHQGNWTASNTGHDITISASSKVTTLSFSGGPLSYDYKVSHLSIHLGILDSVGSEHIINGQPFPAEIQFLAYNSDLFDNFSSARPSPNSIAIIAVMVQIQEKSNPDFNDLLKVLPQIKYKGSTTSLANFNVSKLLPSTDTYFTYFGSFTRPACEEVVTWVILNKPIYVSKSQIINLRKLTKAGDLTVNNVVLMENNFRLPMPLHKRTVRTNIQIKYKLTIDSLVSNTTQFNNKDRVCGDAHEHWTESESHH